MALDSCLSPSRAPILAAVLALASACGGGGSSGAGAWLTLAPRSPEASTLRDQSGSFTVVASWTRTFAEPVSVAATDESGLLIRTEIFDQGSSRYQAVAYTSPALSVGVHRGTLLIRLCLDDAASCQRQVEGSPWRVPYTITVQGFDLRALTPAPGVADWSNLGRDAANNRYVGLTLDPARASLRFWGTLTRDDVCSREMRGVATGGDVVLVATGFNLDDASRCPGGALLTAFDERTGARLWVHDFGKNANEQSSLSPPATSAGQVYVATREAIWAFDRASGAMRWSVPLPAVSWNLAPMVLAEGDGIYLVSEAVPDPLPAGKVIVKYRASDGAVAWTTPVAGAGRPAIRNGMVYALGYRPGTAQEAVVGLRTSDGTVAVAVDPGPTSLWGEAFVALGDRLVCPVSKWTCFDPVEGTALSLGPDAYAIVGSDGRQIMGTTFQGLALADLPGGSVSWSAEPYPDAWWSFWLLTDSHLFADTSLLDRATHAVVPDQSFFEFQALSPRGVGYHLKYGWFYGVNLR